MSLCTNVVVKGSGLQWQHKRCTQISSDEKQQLLAVFENCFSKSNNLDSKIDQIVQVRL